MSEGTIVPFEPGQPVIVGAGPIHGRRWYRTAVRFVDDQGVWIDAAPENQPAIQVKTGEDVTCQTWRIMDALYNAEARITGAREKPRQLVGIVVEKAERTQRREYVRVPMIAEAEGQYLGQTAREEHGRGAIEPIALTMRVVDLSAGGLRGRSSVPMQPGDELTLALPLPRSASSGESRLNVRGRVVDLQDMPPPLDLRARVIRLVERSARDQLFEVGVTFVDLSRETRERIIRFALDVQRDRRRRGLL